MSLLSVPLKIILPWRATVQNEQVPSGFVLCNGQTLNASQQDIVVGSYTVPDLRNMFVVGANLSLVPGGADGGVAAAPPSRTIVGSNYHTLSTSEMPQHYHDISISLPYGADYDAFGSHGHGVSYGAAGAHAHGPSIGGTNFGRTSLGQTPRGIGTSLPEMETYTFLTQPAGAHTHSISVVNAGNHIHIVNMSGAGAGWAFTKRPLYYSVVYIMKVQRG